MLKDRLKRTENPSYDQTNYNIFVEVRPKRILSITRGGGMVFGGGRGLELSIDFVTFCLKRGKGIRYHRKQLNHSTKL